MAVLRIKKELLVLEYIDRGYVVTDKNLCWYAYKYDPVAGIILPPKRPYCWYRTTTYTDKWSYLYAYDLLTYDSADMPAIY